MAKRGKRRGPYPRGCAIATDDSGVALRVLPNVEAAYRWLDKHRPGLSLSEKRGLVKRLPTMKSAREEFDRQIRLGCADADALVMLTYFDGTITARGLDLRACRPSRKPKPSASENGGRRRV
jgi:hypothetical protein